MTFDARESENTNGSSGFIFGGIVALLAGCVFAAVFSLPQPSSAHAQQQAFGLVTIQQIKSEKMSDTATRYFKALERVAPQEHAALIATTSTPLPLNQDVHTLAAQHGMTFLRSKLSSVASIPTQTIDTALDETRTELWIASRERHPLCGGQFYSGLLSSDAPAPSSIDERVEWIKVQNPDVTLNLLTALIEGVENIELENSAPEPRGLLTKQDKIALKGIGMSLASDEQLAAVFIPNLPKEAQLAAIEKIDSCQLAATAISAIKTLPQGTKGRAFSDAVHYFSNSDAKVGDYIFQTFF